jgi:hypothetical protein
MPYYNEQAELQSFRGFLSNISRRQREDATTLIQQEAVRRERERQRSIEAAMNTDTQAFMQQIARGRETVIPIAAPIPALSPGASTTQELGGTPSVRTSVPFSEAEKNERLMAFGLSMMRYGEPGLKRSKEVFDLIEAAGKKKDDAGEWSYETPLKDAQNGNYVSVQSNKKGQIRHTPTDFKYPETEDPFSLFLGKQKADEVNKEAKRYRDAVSKVEQMRSQPETKKALEVLERENMLDASDADLQKMIVTKMLDPGMVQRVKDLRSAESEIKGAEANLTGYGAWVDRKDGWKLKKGSWPTENGSDVRYVTPDIWEQKVKALEKRGYEREKAEEYLRSGGFEKSK